MANRLTTMLMELQHFDLAGPVIPEVDSMLDQVDPRLLLWDNHDRADMRTHGLVFRMPVGKGTLMVSALDHFGEGNAAGRWLLEHWLDELDQPGGPADPRAEVNLDRLRAELSRREVELHQRRWQFQPDPDQQGERLGWQQKVFDDSGWESLKCDRHWDSQGYASLDGWAWYRLEVDVPAWDPDAPLYLNFTGVDDHYRLWVNGQYIGSDGDIATQTTAFDHRTSYDITRQARPGETITIAVAVYDWYGAGGIFRPVTLSTTPLTEDRPWLK